MFYDNSKQSWVFVNTTWKDQAFQRSIAFVEDLAGGRITVWAYSYDGIFTGVYTFGSTWLPFLRVSSQQTGQLCVTPKGTLFIAYGDNNAPSSNAHMVIMRSDDHGNSFTKVGDKIFDNASTYGGPAALACTDSAVYATAMDGGLVEFYFAQP